jgi:hypothetical protein
MYKLVIGTGDLFVVDDSIKWIAFIFSLAGTDRKPPVPNIKNTRNRFPFSTP